MAQSLAAAGLVSAPVTEGWAVLKEGYLVVTKGPKTTTGSQKKKLRYVVLYQNPDTLESRLSYYVGKTLRGSILLNAARATPYPGAKLQIHTTASAEESLTLQAEESDADISKEWTLAIQGAIEQSTRQAMRPKSADPILLPHSPGELSAIVALFRWTYTSADGRDRIAFSLDAKLTIASMPTDQFVPPHGIVEPMKGLKTSLSLKDKTKSKSTSAKAARASEPNLSYSDHDGLSSDDDDLGVPVQPRGGGGANHERETRAEWLAEKARAGDMRVSAL